MRRPDTEGILKVIAMDVTEAESVRNAAIQLNDVAIDLLINNAGIASPSGARLRLRPVVSRKPNSATRFCAALRDNDRPWWSP